MPEPVLAYCTNVAAAPSVAELTASVESLWRDVRERAGLDRLGLGLWFPRDVAAQLARDPAALDRLRAALDRAALDAVTYNAFPAEAFHAPVVKEAVYRPDWTTDARRDYTLDVARIAAALAPRGATVPISTLALGYPRWDDVRVRAAVARVAALGPDLDRLAEETGVRVVVALEPEPCCALERTADAVAAFRGADPDLVRHAGVCLDLCHAAVAHEDPVAALAVLGEHGVPVRKVQVSAALHVPDPADRLTRERLLEFAETRWLHQVGTPDGRMCPDLPLALADPVLAAEAPWRVHFHVPLHRAEVGGLPTTREDVARFLRHVRSLPHPPLLELETYTWSVVPGAGEDLAENVAAEIRWAAAVLAEG